MGDTIPLAHRTHRLAGSRASSKLGPYSVYSHHEQMALLFISSLSEQKKGLRPTLRHPCVWLHSTAELCLVSLENVGPSQGLFELAVTGIEESRLSVRI